MPQELMWRKGTSWTALPVDTFLTVGAFCRSLLEREQLREELRREKFDIAIVDILYNECSLALAHDLGEDARTLLVCITVSFISCKRIIYQSNCHRFHQQCNLFSGLKPKLYCDTKCKKIA